jgi:L-ribulose-5-phosphate 3-epimerase
VVKYAAMRPEAPFRISLAEWSLHRAVRSGALDHLDFPLSARRDYDIEAVEYVSTLFRQRDDRYLHALRSRAEESGVRSLLIMIDGEGQIGDPDPTLRAMAVGSHARWVDAAAILGCHSIRINAESAGTAEEQHKLVADGLRRLCEIADLSGIDVAIENHGGLSSDPDWLAAVVRAADHQRAGTLPDFGNFTIRGAGGGEIRRFDRYDGVRKLMPYARGVSAKAQAFDAAGNETTTDFAKMLGVVVDGGYRGYIGVEYEGEDLSEPEGIRATKALLERVRERMAAAVRMSS